MIKLSAGTSQFSLTLPPRLVRAGEDWMNADPWGRFSAGTSWVKAPGVDQVTIENWPNKPMVCSVYLPIAILRRWSARRMVRRMRHNGHNLRVREGVDFWDTRWTFTGSQQAIANVRAWWG